MFPTSYTLIRKYLIHLETFIFHNNIQTLIGTAWFSRFEVDAPIILTHLGFPAPDQDDACYDVAIQIQVQSTNSLIYQTNQSIVCKRRSVMKVSCESSVVRLEPGVLYK